MNRTIEEKIKKRLNEQGFSNFFIKEFIKSLQLLIIRSFQEDLNDVGDITSEAIFDSQQISEAQIIAKQSGIFCGEILIEAIAAHIDENLQINCHLKDGEQLTERQRVATINGSIKSILIAERTILNFISRTSGIATLCRDIILKLGNSNITILDTRKTIPGWRYLDKYAVRIGGANNHRIGLFDMFLIKENHIKAAGGIKNAVKKCREYAGKYENNIAIEVETRNINEVREAIEQNVDRIMLDNMSHEEIRKSSEIIRKANKKIEIEISGGVSIQNIETFSDIDVDFISMGSLTHSVKAFDFSLLVL